MGDGITVVDVQDRLEERALAMHAVDVAYRGLIEKAVHSYIADAATCADADVGVANLRKAVRVASAARKDALAIVAAELPDPRVPV